MTLIDALRAASLPIWLLAALITLPGTWRFMRGHPRSLDGLWLGALLLAVNRVSFQINSLWGPSGWMRTWCYATALAAGVAWICIMRGYQRHDS